MQVGEAGLFRSGFVAQLIANMGPEFYPVAFGFEVEDGPCETSGEPGGEWGCRADNTDGVALFEPFRKSGHVGRLHGDDGFTPFTRSILLCNSNITVS